MDLRKICEVCSFVGNASCTVFFRLRKVHGVFIYGKPEMSVIAFGSNDFNIYRLSDALAESGWNLNALQFPSRYIPVGWLRGSAVERQSLAATFPVLRSTCS